MSVETDVNDPAGADGDRRLAREVAQRVFAAEFGLTINVDELEFAPERDAQAEAEKLLGALAELEVA